jgi:hypothetical protein
LDGDTQVKKIAYAASFGVNEWEFTPTQTKKCSTLTKQFNAISVREESAVNLCKKYLNISAIQVLDPTLLLEKEDYIHLIEKDNIPEKKNLLFSYILDVSDEKTTFIHKIAEKLNLEQVSGMPSNSIHLKKSKKDLSDCIFPMVTEWLAGFRDAKFIITDSFHGMVFSIIFNKPFIVYGNVKRGMERFNSLLNELNLKNRLIHNIQDLNGFGFGELSDNIDWIRVNNKMEEMKRESLRFLISALSTK